MHAHVSILSAELRDRQIVEIKRLSSTTEKTRPRPDSGAAHRARLPRWRLPKRLHRALLRIQ
jgi:hypothetical protein